MRNTGRGTWAAFVETVRTAAGISKTELSRRLGVDRATISRWEAGHTKPEDPAVVVRFAELLGLDLMDTLVAAGLLPESAHQRRTPPAVGDPELEALLTKLRKALADPRTNNTTRDYALGILRDVAGLIDQQRRRRAG